MEQIFKQIAKAEFFFFDVMNLMFRRPYRFSQLINQMYFIGNQSLGIILLTGFFTGAVFGLQIGGIFQIFRAESMMGGATALSLAKELAPLVSAFILTGRVGSSIAAELATMVVNEQVLALEAMGVNPINYLVVPRVWASLLMTPLLCGIFMIVGIGGAWVIGVYLFDVDQGVFWTRLTDLLRYQDIMSGIRKMFVFGFMMGIVSCYHGLTAQGGAKGVGTATTLSVVRTLLGILTLDFIISYLETKWL